MSIVGIRKSLSLDKNAMGVLIKVTVHTLNNKGVSPVILNACEESNLLKPEITQSHSPIYLLLTSHKLGIRCK